MSKHHFPDDWNITFNLFTPNDSNKQIILNFTANDTQIKNSGFDPQIRTKFIIHGWMSGYYTLSIFNRQWMKVVSSTTTNDFWLTNFQDLKDNILGQTNANVFCVDWSVPAGSYIYAEVVPKVPKIGQMVAHFINKLLNLMNTSTNDMHCIGHSLGAHVCGFAGSALFPDKLAQITGLDPAWPEFGSQKSISPLDYWPLSANDANLVLVMHTSGGFYSSGFLGNPFPLGHYDFRLNGGLNLC